MCGIAGAWLAAGQLAPLDALVRALAHRGPDGSGKYVDAGSGVALVHTRLAVIDLSEGGAQPMYSADGEVALVFNGEIYNHRELAAELAVGGTEFRGRSDTEVLLELYLREGMAMLPRLNGIFAFAIHDRRKAALFLARDAFGVKPLYVMADAERFAFASEIKALLPFLAGAQALDFASLQRYMTYLYCPGTGTPFAGVRKLAPGAALMVESGRVTREWRWHVPAVKRSMAPLPRREAVASVQAGLRRAVERQLVADVPVGAFLSGGLDSSAVVAFAREKAPDLRCFTIEQTGGGDAGDAPDLPYAQRVAKHLGVRLDVVQVDAARMAHDLEEMVWQLDEPLADPAPLNVLYISRLARGQGIKVLLSGAGGDDLFTGYRRHVALTHEAWWTWLPAAVRRALAASSRHLDQRSAFGRRLARLFADAGATADERLVGYFAWQRRSDLLPLLARDFRAAVAAVRPEEPLLEFLAGIPPGVSRLQRMLALEQRFFLPDHNLNYTDKMAMAVGVEVRVPFLDEDLVNLAARIPDRYKQRGRTGKWVLKKAMEPYLPHEVIYRPKTGFGAPLRRWMRHELREWLGDMLSEQSLRRRGLFDPVAVQRLIADNDAGRRDAAHALLSLLCIEIWCRRFLDRPGGPPADA